MENISTITNNILTSRKLLEIIEQNKYETFIKKIIIE